MIPRPSIRRTDQGENRAGRRQFYLPDAAALFALTPARFVPEAAGALVAQPGIHRRVTRVL